MFLFKSTPTTNFGDDDIGRTFTVKTLRDEFKEAFKDAFSTQRFTTFFTKLEDQAAKTSRSISAGMSENISKIESSIFDIYKKTIGIGGKLSDTTDFITALSDGLGKVPALFDDTIERAIALSQITGISVKEIGEYTASFANIGMGQKQAMDNLTKIYANAKKFGVDSSKLTKTVTENIQKASSYGFKNGVEGLTKMAAQAQRLGISMDKMFTIADKALDPEGAIEMAASMQMLGGNVGALADPFKLMYLAQNDIEGLQKEFIKAAESSATFNKETGQFEIKGQQMLRLRAQAEALGLSYDDIADAAIKAAKEQKVMSQIPLTAGLSEEQKGIISSLAEINNGVAEVRLPGTDQMVEVSKLTNGQIDALVTMNKDAAKLEGPNAKKGLDFSDLKSVAEKQFSQAEKQTIILNEIRNSIVLQAKTQGMQIPKTMTDALEEGKEKTDRYITDNDMVNEVTQGATTAVLALGNYITNTTGLESDMDDILIAINRSKGGTTDEQIGIEDAFFPSAGPPKIMSEGKIFEGIRGDQVAVGPNLDSAFQMSVEQMRKTKAITEALGTNLEGVGDPFKNMVSSKLPPFMSDTSSKLQQTVSTINNNINVSGGANVSGSVDVKVTGSGLNLDDSKLSAMISSKVSAAIEERLSKRWGEKQGNIKTA